MGWARLFVFLLYLILRLINLEQTAYFKQYNSLSLLSLLCFAFIFLLVGWPNINHIVYACKSKMICNNFFILSYYYFFFKENYFYYLFPISVKEKEVDI